MAGNYTDNANVFKALSDENRLKVLELLLDGEKCVSELLEKMSIGQSTLSHHIKLMCVSGIIKSRKSGTATYYSINPDGAKSAIELLRRLTGVEEEVEPSRTVRIPVYEEIPWEKFAAKAPQKEEPTEEKKEEPASPVRQKGSRPNGWLL
ncbi:MAG: winged helix-turn-helix transcriptional regulator [Clostridia bacterium]|nr:winged helix-turn-helix transcriptional regulator [Clostridia bacterium]